MKIHALNHEQLTWLKDMNISTENHFASLLSNQSTRKLLCCSLNISNEQLAIIRQELRDNGFETNNDQPVSEPPSGCLFLSEKE